VVTDNKQNKKLRDSSTPREIPDSLNLVRASSSTLVLLLFLSQQEQMVMLARCRGKNRMVQAMQNQQVRKGAEKDISPSDDDDDEVFVEF